MVVQNSGQACLCAWRMGSKTAWKEIDLTGIVRAKNVLLTDPAQQWMTRQQALQDPAS